jgi:hypothetical protein
MYSPLMNITSQNGMNYGVTIWFDMSTYEGDLAINVLRRRENTFSSKSIQHLVSAALAESQAGQASRD